MWATSVLLLVLGGCRAICFAAGGELWVAEIQSLMSAPVLLPSAELSPYGQLGSAFRFLVDVERLASSWVEPWVAVFPLPGGAVGPGALLPCLGAFSRWASPVGLPELGGCRATCLQLG